MEDKIRSEEQSAIEAEVSEQTADECRENSVDDELQKVLRLIEDKNKQVEEWSTKYKYLLADFENFRRRSRLEKEELSQVITESIVLKLLPVIDNFERALSVGPGQNAASILEGVDMIYRQLMSTLEKLEIRPIVAVGAAFDPNLHEAVATAVSDNSPDGTILEEFQRGYTLGSKAIRPSMVKVAANS